MSGGHGGHAAPAARPLEHEHVGARLTRLDRRADVLVLERAIAAQTPAQPSPTITTSASSTVGGASAASITPYSPLAILSPWSRPRILPRPRSESFPARAASPRTAPSLRIRARSLTQAIGADGAAASPGITGPRGRN